MMPQILQRSVWYLRLLVLLMPALLLFACSTPNRSLSNKPADLPVAKSNSSAATPLPKAGSGRGGYYQDDGPGDVIPPDLESTVDPVPVIEPYAKSGNKPYVVFGKTYSPLTDEHTPFKQRGTASWYGKKFHGHKTSSGELYDMYKITAAHPTLPIPSYARVTNLANGKQIIVRINDRGPFHSSRIMDLSYTAALKLGYLGSGSGQIEVERLLPEDIERMAENRKNQKTDVALSSTLAIPDNKAGVAQVADKSSDNKADQISMEDLLMAQNQISREAGDSGNTGTGTYYIQFGAFAIRANAENILNRLKERAENRLPSCDIVQQGTLYRLLSGPFASRDQARAALASAGELGLSKALIVQR